jgi:hypothetical protein
LERFEELKAFKERTNSLYMTSDSMERYNATKDPCLPRLQLRELAALKEWSLKQIQSLKHVWMETRTVARDRPMLRKRKPLRDRYCARGSSECRNGDSNSRRRKDFRSVAAECIRTTILPLLCAPTLLRTKQSWKLCGLKQS